MDNIIRKEIIRKKKNSLVSRVWTNNGTFLFKEDFADNNGDRLGHEYFISSSIDLKSVLKPVSFESNHNSSILVYEDIDGEFLDNTEIVDNMNTREKLVLALKISDILKDLHSVGIIHNHLSLDTIIYNSRSRKIRITDFTGSRIFLDEHEASDNIKPVDSVSPFYISPEQTGKVLKPIDYRTDLYSAGVIFYRIFTGKFPFEDGDIIKRHLEDKPVFSDDINDSVKAIISKLLLKDPDDRYQSSYALKRDITDCIRNRKLKRAGSNDINFKPEFDHPVPVRSAVRIINSLRKRGRTVFFMNGKSGSGKSFAVKYLENRLKLENSVYLKIESFEIAKTISFYSLVKSLKPFIDEISEELGSLPDFVKALFYGRSEEDFTKCHDKNALIYSFLRIIKKIFNGRKALIIVEDCEYIDKASMEIIDCVIRYEKFDDLFVLFTSGVESFNKASGLDPEGFKDIFYRNESLQPFTLNDSLNFVSKSLFSDKDKSSELSSYLHEVTNGEPYFLTLLTDYLFKKDLIQYNRHRGNFLWNLNRIKSSKIPDTFEKLLFEIIDDYSEELKGFVYSASVYGLSFSGENLKEILNCDKGFDLKNAENLIIPNSPDFFDLRFRTRKVSSVLKKTISKEFLDITRKNFARVILKGISHGDIFRIFVSVFFLNRAKKLIKDHEILSHAELNLFCAVNLVSIFRYEEALFHFDECCFRTDELFKSDGELLKKIYRNIIETSYFACDFTRMEKYSDELGKIDNGFVLDIEKLSRLKTFGNEDPGQVKKEVLRVGKFVLPEKKLNINDLSNEIVIKALRKFKGNKSKAAGYLGISRQALYRRLEKINKIS